MNARIYRPSRTATQSGQARSKNWVLEFPPEFAPQIDPLMGWTGTRDTRRQVRLWFGTQAEAAQLLRLSPVDVFEAGPI